MDANGFPGPLHRGILERFSLPRWLVGLLALCGALAWPWALWASLKLAPRTTVAIPLWSSDDKCCFEDGNRLFVVYSDQGRMYSVWDMRTGKVLAQGSSAAGDELWEFELLNGGWPYGHKGPAIALLADGTLSRPKRSNAESACGTSSPGARLP